MGKEHLRKFFRHYSKMFAWAGFALGMGFAAIFKALDISIFYFIIAGFGAVVLHYYHFTKVQNLRHE
jgi:hypothetical protein